MLQGPLFMSMGWCSSLLPNPVTAPWNGSPRRESCSSVRHLFRRRMCGKRQCSRQNMKQMLTRPGALQGSAPGFGVRVMGWYGGEEGEGKMDIGLRCGARVRSREKFRTSSPHPDFILLVRPGYVRLCDGFASYWHIVSRHISNYSEILQNSGELFRD